MEDNEPQTDAMPPRVNPFSVWPFEIDPYLGPAQAMEAGLTDPTAIAKFTNQVGAVGITMGIDSDQIGRDLNLMLGGHAGGHVKTWGALAANIRDVAKGLHLSAGSASAFNKLRPEQRLQLINAATAKYGDMIKAFGNTWATQSTTFTGFARQIFQVATAPLFDRMKNTLGEVNTWLSANHDKVQEIANAVAQHLVVGFDRAKNLIIEMIPKVEHLATTIGMKLHEAFSRVEAVVVRIRAALEGHRAHESRCASPRSSRIRAASDSRRIASDMPAQISAGTGGRRRRPGFLGAGGACFAFIDNKAAAAFGLTSIRFAGRPALLPLRAGFAAAFARHLVQISPGRSV